MTGVSTSPSARSIEQPIKIFKNAAAWEKWLLAHAGSPGVWLKIAKKGVGVASVTIEEAIDVALCHGWIDGLRRGCDERHFLQRFTPRRKQSLWSKINVAKAEKLIAAGRMGAGGQREIDAAKADGRWAVAYDSARSMPVPDELAAALAKNKKAKAFFDQIDRTNRYAFCWRVQTAKKPETRAARVEKFVAMLAKGEKIHG
ncbi:YdeI/OmpD-associated family protein [Luteimonas sp. SX5]|uniref:YdeI/OmpD-associated family protein n=1 Tax=Luteimonas galliterrae TaxID=2940486 RepID=A0ABT0MGA2_9GAMM|nr:YdeI/OmpD-associated family protein [Luteimonas galliterrae]MCL1633892.1 YdeI/OmpD-associated family protein [Luteimonas galliterrae]